MTVELNRQHEGLLGEYVWEGAKLAAGDSYWIVRIRVYEDQYVIASPRTYKGKTTWAIGFARGSKTPRFAPYTEEAEEIYETVKHNKTYGSLSRRKTIEAITLLQDALLKDI